MKAGHLNEAHFATIGELVRQHTGLSFSDSRRQHAESGIRQAMAAHATDPERFIALLRSDERVLQSLVENLTVAETYFFREREQFEMVRRLVLPELRRRIGERGPLRLWSAGCASGEEPYSLAILLEQEGLAGQAHVLGTDISRVALSRARKASYGAWSLRDNPQEMIAQYFRCHGDKYVLIERIRQAVEFATFNLASASYAGSIAATGPFDLILSRNVLIYFDPDTIARVARQMLASLSDGGWLITGPSDPPLWQHAAFETVLTPAGVLYRRRDGGAAARQPEANIGPPRAIVRQPDAVAVDAPINSPGLLARPVMPLKPHRSHRGSNAENSAMPSLPDTGSAARNMLGLQSVASQRDPHRIAAAVEAARGAHPLSPAVHYFEAIDLMSAGRYDDAMIALRRAIYLDRSMAVAHFALGSIMQRRGSIVEAQRSYRNVLAVCDRRRVDEIVPYSDGEPVGRLIDAARAQLALIAGKGIHP